MTNNTPALSIVINTKDAAATLQHTLDSIAPFDAEVIVMDMASSDETVEIARTAGVTVYTHPDVGYVEPARNAAIAKANGRWILILDADETLSKSCRENISELIASSKSKETVGEAEIVAYSVPRKNYIFKSWVKHTGWWPDYQLRLFQKGSVTWSDQIHSVPKVAGVTQELEAKQELAIIHQQYPTVTDFIQKLDRYTAIEADSPAQNDGKSDKDFSPDAFIETYFSEIFSRLFAEKGIKDGNHGVSLSFLQANYQLITQLKLWQRAGFKQIKNEDAVLNQLEKSLSDLRYWIADYQVSRTQGLKQVYWKLRRAVRV
ncbi:MAG: glycosyltransferase family 2 protein [Patescibacteria group bacterium]